MIVARLRAALRATLTAWRRPRGSDDEDGPSAPSGVNLCLRPAATGFTVAVPSRVTDAALVEVAEAVRRAMRDVESGDASRLLFEVGRAVGEIVIERDTAWLLMCADALAAGERP